MLSEPLSSYRIQLNKEFDFDAAAKLVTYLDDLGIDYLYCSPYFQAVPGSKHGYDVVDHSTVNAEWGGADGHARMCESLKRHGMRQLLDIVPNHMAITGRENPWWWDVLENGPSSTYAAFFDVDWEPPERRLNNSVLLPVLEDQYGVLVESGKLKVAREPDGFVVRYGDRIFPVAPRSMRILLDAAAGLCSSDKLAFLADVFSELPSPSSTDIGSISRRHRDKRVLSELLTRMLHEDKTLAGAIDAAIAQLNSDPDRLHEFLEHQNFRLAYWRMASRELGYRRFFDINSLVGLRMENDWVFAATHSLILKWVAEGSLSGLRVDHPDGLRDPERYFERLRKAGGEVWIVAEKILLKSETLRESWAVEGTSGYDFLNLSAGLFVDPSGEEPLTRFYQEFSGESCDYAAAARAKKQLAMRESLGSDINRLTELFLNVCENDRCHRDYSRHILHEALRAALACLGVYRTYVREAEKLDLDDLCRISTTIDLAKSYRTDLDPRLFDFLEQILTLRVPGDAAVELAMRFQQTAAAVMAKGVEDTLFYSFNRMIALNEVGGDPESFGVAREDFYRWCQFMHHRWPRTMLSTSTHDTKRSEDVRARLYVLSEIPGLWREAVMSWSGINERHRTGEFPDRNFEYHLYQILVGAWPIEKQRLLAYAEKAAREAKVYTSWNDQNRRYEEAIRKFIDGILADGQFLDAIDRFVKPLILPGRINSLSQTLLKLTAPGVPDFYQGTELWNLALVDPDNRRPVDFDLRRALLADLLEATPEQVMNRMDEGLPKLWLINRGLVLRRRHPEWFGAKAGFQPLIVQGSRAGHVIAFARSNSVIAVAPRFITRAGGDWHNTQIALPGGEWTNHLTGDRWPDRWIRVQDLLRRFPVALLSLAGTDG